MDRELLLGVSMSNLLGQWILGSLSGSDSRSHHADDRSPRPRSVCLPLVVHADIVVMPGYYICCVIMTPRLKN